MIIMIIILITIIIIIFMIRISASVTLTKQKGSIGGGINISMIIITSSIISTIIISLFSTPALLWLFYLRSASHYARAPASESWRGSFLSPNQLPFGMRSAAVLV